MGKYCKPISIMQKLLLNVNISYELQGKSGFYHFSSKSYTHSTLSLEEKLERELPREKISSENPSIYRVPENLRRVEAKAYEPNIVSVGPFHHGKPHLQQMEKIKRMFCRRLLNPKQEHCAPQKLQAVVKAIKEMEVDARSHYSEELKLSTCEFVDMMIIDGCFILELFRKLYYNNNFYSDKKPPDDQILHEDEPRIFLQRWMLPTLRYDLIMLENQLPFSVLSKLSELVAINDDDRSLWKTSSSNSLLQRLAIDFFAPLMPGVVNVSDQGIPHSEDQDEHNGEAKHLLDLFRSRILPSGNEIRRGSEPYLFRSIDELRESGVKIKRRVTRSPRPLDIEFENGTLEIPQFCINDYKCTLYRNMVAFEQCHRPCEPDVTRFLFFLDGLINSTKDVEILHYAGVLQHSLGNNKYVAHTVNKLCREMSLDMEESYLCEVVQRIKEYCDEPWHRQRAILMHNYFTNPWVSVSTVVAAVLLYLAVLQTCCDLAESHHSLHESGFWMLFGKSFTVPFFHPFSTVRRTLSHFDGFHEFLWLYC